jgi:rod shape-determining protein MreD
MDDPLTLRIWLGRLIYLLIAFAIMFTKLLPLDTTPDGIPGPDLLLATTLAWVMRRPEQVPALLIVAVFLICDLLFLRPPGLLTLIVLGATEFLRARISPTREMPFAAECGIVAVILTVTAIAEQMTLSIFVLPKPGLGIALLQALLTLVVYPLIVVGLRYGLGLRRIAPGDFYDTGRRL